MKDTRPCTKCNKTQVVLIETMIENKGEAVCFECYSYYYGRERALMFFNNMPEDWKK